MSRSPDTGLPYLTGSDSQPAVIVNEAIAMLQILLKGVIFVGDNSPPAGSSGDPVQAGDAFVVGTSPTGAWAGRANCIAYYTGSGYLFIPGQDDSGTPITMGLRQNGMHVFNQADGRLWRWDGDSWEVYPTGTSSSGP